MIYVCISDILSLKLQLDGVLKTLVETNSGWLAEGYTWAWHFPGSKLFEILANDKSFEFRLRIVLDGVSWNRENGINLEAEKKKVSWTIQRFAKGREPGKNRLYQNTWWYMVPNFSLPRFEKYLQYWNGRCIFPKCS